MPERGERSGTAFPIWFVNLQSRTLAVFARIWPRWTSSSEGKGGEVISGI